MLLSAKGSRCSAGEELLKIDMGSNKFCEVISNKLLALGVNVKDSLVRRPSLTFAKEEVDSLHSSPSTPTLSDSPSKPSAGPRPTPSGTKRTAEAVRGRNPQTLRTVRSSASTDWKKRRVRTKTRRS